MVFYYRKQTPAKQIPAKQTPALKEAASDGTLSQPIDTVLRSLSLLVIVYLFTPMLCSEFSSVFGFSSSFVIVREIYPSLSSICA